MLATRKELLEQGVLSAQGAQIRFEVDHLFRSPSAASGLLLGRSSNGWDDWKDASGRSLDTVERQAVQDGVDAVTGRRSGEVVFGRLGR
ncbi:DUF4357 domain-containing protein [Xanthomonas translucens]